MPTAEALDLFLRHLANRRGRCGRITSPETVCAYTSAVAIAFVDLGHLGHLGELGELGELAGENGDYGTGGREGLQLISTPTPGARRSDR